MSAAAQTSLKYGVSRVSVDETAGVFMKALSFFSSPFVLLGFGLYGSGAILWLFALRNIDVSLAYPFVSMAIVLVFLSGTVLLGEPFTTPKLLGVVLIVAGLVTLSQA